MVFRDRRTVNLFCAILLFTLVLASTGPDAARAHSSSTS